MPGVVAIVPTYEPDPADLGDLVACLRSWHIPIVVSDDASRNTEALADLGPDVHVIRHDGNEGIARALNEGLQAARDASADWLLTVDQDTTLGPTYLSALLRQAERATAALDTPLGAVAAGQVNDASGRLMYPTTWVRGIPVTAEVIQTGTLWSVTGLARIGGFDEFFGIDAVDAAACVRLRAAGMPIILAPEARLRHRIGHATSVRILGRRILATGHSAQRRESIVRNRLLLAPEEYRQSPMQAFRSLRRLASGTVLAVTIEDDRWQKAKATLRGVRRAWTDRSPRGDSVARDERSGSA